MIRIQFTLKLFNSEFLFVFEEIRWITDGAGRNRAKIVKEFKYSCLN